MKQNLALLGALALAGAAFASVDPSRPMVTGRGNVTARPTKVIVTNQTAEKSLAAPTAPTKADEKTSDAVDLEKFVVTGSLLKKPQTKSGKQ